MPEAEVDPHTIERIRDRITSMSKQDLPDGVKENILMVFDKVEALDFPKNRNYIVFLGDIPINTNSRYYHEFRGGGYYKIAGSIGNQFWVVVRNNKITTFMLATDFQTQNAEKNAKRVNVDYSIRDIDEFKQSLGNRNVKRERIPTVNINGVKWVVDTDNETIHKKNKPVIKHKIVDMIDTVDKATQDAIMNFF